MKIYGAVDKLVDTIEKLILMNEVMRIQLNSIEESIKILDANQAAIISRLPDYEEKIN